MKPEEILKRPDGILDRKPYGKDEVLIYKIGNILRMVFESVDSPERDIQSQVDIKNPWNIVSPLLQSFLLSLIWQPNSNNIYKIGIGGGVVPSFLHHYLPEAKITATDTSQEVINLAQEYFGFRYGKNLKVFARDGRDFLEKSTTKYDLILIDVYGSYGDSPRQFMTYEFHKLCRDHLTDNGAVLVNMLSKYPLHQAKVHTMSKVYSHLALVPMPETEKNNCLVIGFQQGETDKQLLMTRAQALEERFKLKFSLQDHVSRMLFDQEISQIMPSMPNSPILHD